MATTARGSSKSLPDHADANAAGETGSTARKMSGNYSGYMGTKGKHHREETLKDYYSA
jgi:hypothetical protein